MTASLQSGQQKARGDPLAYLGFSLSVEECDFQEPQLGAIGGAAIPQWGGTVTGDYIAMNHLVGLTQEVSDLFGFGGFNDRGSGVISDATVGQIHIGNSLGFVWGLFVRPAADEFIVPGLTAPPGD